MALANVKAGSKVFPKKDCEYDDAEVDNHFPYYSQELDRGICFQNFFGFEIPETMTLESVALNKFLTLTYGWWDVPLPISRRMAAAPAPLSFIVMKWVQLHSLYRKQRMLAMSSQK